MATVAETSSRLIKLADEPDFTLGAISVEPAYRQVRWGDQARTVEPRVMQVLVALGREPGVIVSRETLARRCWHGRIVGENALQRVISLLRQLATESDAFRIETITKVGYRLLVTAQAALAPEKPPQVAGLRSRRAVLAGAAGLIGAGVGALWLGPLSSRRRTALRL